MCYFSVPLVPLCGFYFDQEKQALETLLFLTPLLYEGIL